MKSKYLFILLPLFLLSGCGTQLKEVYSGTDYNDPIFENNYYNIYPDSLLDEDNITEIANITLSSDDFIQRHDDISLIDPEITSTSPRYTSYGETYKLSNVDDSFKEGYLSKLFDGLMFCNGYYQLSRVQLDESGFGMEFKKQITSYDYFVMNFKPALNFVDGTSVSSHTSDISITVSFYMNTDNGLNKVNINADIYDMPTNATETNTSSTYTFFAFNLNNILFNDIDFTNLCAMSIRYDLLNDEVASENSDKESYYALMLYEVLFPNSIWA